MVEEKSCSLNKDVQIVYSLGNAKVNVIRLIRLIINIKVKQYAEEKFSATSLSAVNIRNENTKSRAKKDYRELFPNTPIRFGKHVTSIFSNECVLQG